MHGPRQVAKPHNRMLGNNLSDTLGSVTISTRLPRYVYGFRSLVADCVFQISNFMFCIPLYMVSMRYTRRKGTAESRGFVEKLLNKEV